MLEEKRMPRGELCGEFITPECFPTLKRLGVQDRDLEDVVHEVFITVHRRLCDYDPTRPLRAWVIDRSSGGIFDTNPGVWPWS